MVGSSFIHIKRDGRRTVLNAREIASVFTEEYDLTTPEGQLLFKRYDPALGMIYIVRVTLTSQYGLEFLFAVQADRETFYEQLLTAIAPAATITVESPRLLPSPWDPEAEAEERRREREERDREIALEIRERIQREAAWLKRPIAPGEMYPLKDTAPSEKPPRKPYTRKPRE